MGKKNKLPFIPLQPYNMDAAFAGKQYIINDAFSSSCDNSEFYSIFRDTIYRLLYANFSWDGDITPLESRALEKMLLTNGRVCAIRTHFDVDQQTPEGIFYGYYGSEGIATPTYDFYGNPLEASCTGLNGRVYTTKNPDDFVIGFDTTAININGQIITTVSSYIERLARLLDEAYQAWRVAVETHKQGIVFYVPNKQMNNILENVLNKLSANHPYITLQGSMQEQAQVFFRTTGADAVSVYHQNLMNAWSLVMDLIGIENESEQKRERLVVAEAIRNGSLAICVGADRLRAREIFAEQVKEKLGITITPHNYFKEILREDKEGLQQEDQEPDEQYNYDN